MAGYMHNCLVQTRANCNTLRKLTDIPHKGKPLFTQTENNDLIAELDGYAVIPLEEYEKLSGKDMSELLVNVEDPLYIPPSQ
jgi:hypothetical protein